ncbi:MAG: outer membrane protein assembly factor BamA [Parachlamydiaceae bacterium]
MKVKCLIFLHFLISLALCNLDAAPLQYENHVVGKIIVTMSGPFGSTYDSTPLKARLKTREGAFFSQNDFDGDLKMLAQEFDRVDPSLEIVDDKLQIQLRIFPRPIIRTITWLGNDKIDAATLHKELGISLCSVFDRITFNKAFHKLKGYYIKKGFFEAELNYEVKLDETKNEVDIIVCISEGRSGKIKDIVFCNFCSSEEDAILDMMVTKKYNLFTSWITNEGIYNDEAMQHDQLIILNHLQNQGFADARITIDVDECERDRIIITVIADRGPQYKISKVTFEGNHLYSDDDIWNQIKVCEDDIFSPDAIRESSNRIDDFYGRRGFIDANVNFECRLDPKYCAYSVHFTIEEGEQFRVGLIKVLGNCSTQTNVILNETLIVPGEVFNSEKLRKTEERLTNIGYFSHVNVYAVQSDSCQIGEGNFRDVHIEVEETSTGNFGLFFGYSTAETLFGGINITEKNFNYKGLGSLFSRGYPGLRGGGEYAHLTFSVGNKSRNYILSWTKPYFMDTLWSVGFDLEKSSNRYISNDYDIDAKGLTLHANYEINAFVRFGWHYRLRDSHTHISSHEAKEESSGLRRAAKRGGLVSATGYDISYDSTDNLEFPSNGFRSRFEMEYAGLGGDHRFWSVAYLNSYYYPLCPKGVIKFRFDSRVITPIAPTKFNSLPLDERLFLGGDNVVRGYKAYRIGPHFNDSKDPKGGITMQIASIEYNHRLFKKMDGFLFLDAGLLSHRKWDFNSRIYYSCGFGARIKVMESFPPVCLGFGFPLSYERRKEVRRFFISFGGRF